MKKLMWLLFLPVAVFAQVNNPSVRYVAVAPSGSCSASPPVQVVASTGVVYTCNNGTWSSQAGEATGPGGAHNSVQYNDAGDFGGVPTSTFGVLSSDGLGDAPTFVPPFAVDITQPPYNAKCDGSTDDHVAIQAALDNNAAVMIPVSSGGPTECMLGTVGITLCSATNKGTGYNALYGNGQLIGGTGSGSLITIGNTCDVTNQIGMNRVEDLYIDDHAMTGTPTIFHLVNASHVVLENVNDGDYNDLAGPYTSVWIDDTTNGKYQTITNYYGQGSLTVNGASDSSFLPEEIHLESSIFDTFQANFVISMSIDTSQFLNFYEENSNSITNAEVTIGGVSFFEAPLSIGGDEGANVRLNGADFGNTVTISGSLPSYVQGNADFQIPFSSTLFAGTWIGNINAIDSTNTNYNLSNGLVLPPFSYSVAGTPLPTCNGSLNAPPLQVLDATLPTFNGTYVGGGTVPQQVFCNGTNWVTY